MDEEEEIEINSINKSSIKRGNKEYVFGQRYYYWSSYKSHPWFIPKKYNNLKEEMLSNGFPYHLYNLSVIKCKNLLNGSDILKKMKSNNDNYGQISQIKYDDSNIISNNLPLQIENLLSLIFYVDFDVFAFKLKSTFMKQYIDETDISLKMRHSVFANWSKIMTETIELYGTSLRFNKISTLYHSTEFMHYGLFTATFNSPTSMTRYLEVATMFTNDDGLILEMTQYPKIRPKYFDTSIISNYGYEHELLFIPSDKTMDIQSIRIMKENEDHKLFIKAMRLFNKVHFRFFVFFSCFVDDAEII